MLRVLQAYDFISTASKFHFRAAPCFQVCMRTDKFLSFVEGNLKAWFAPQLPWETQTRQLQGFDFKQPPAALWTKNNTTLLCKHRT